MSSSSTGQEGTYMAAITDWYFSRDTPRKSTSVPARPQEVATSVGSAKCDNTTPDGKGDLEPCKNASDEVLKHWADLMSKQKLKRLFNKDHGKSDRIQQQKTTAGDVLKSIVPQAVVHKSSFYDHGPGGDGGPEVFLLHKKAVRAVTAPSGRIFKESIKNTEK